MKTAHVEAIAMKKKVLKLISFCDICGKESSGYQTCRECGKDFCYDCMNTDAISYQHGVSFSGSGDGLYCLDCDAKLRQSGDKLHAAYRKIQVLRNEANGYWQDHFL